MQAPGSSPGVEATQPADVALPLGRGARWTWLSRLAEYAGFLPALVLFGLFFLVPLGLIVCLQLLADGRLQRRPRLDGRQLPLLLQRPDLRPRRCGRRSGSRSRRPRSRSRSRSPSPTGSSRYVPKRSRRLLLVLVILPFWTSYLLRVYSWLNILGAAGRDQPVPARGRASRPAGLVLPLRPARR